jgi:hypothetical protein
MHRALRYILQEEQIPDNRRGPRCAATKRMALWSKGEMYTGKMAKTVLQVQASFPKQLKIE